MAELRISSFENGFVLYFETPQPRINAYALAATLTSLADSVKAAGRTLNSAVDIEVVVEALTAGSFRATVSAIARESGIFVRQQLLIGIVIGVLANYIYDHTLAKKDHMEVIVNTDEVIITQGEDRIIVPRIVYDAKQIVSQNPTFTRSIDRMMGSVVIDERVTGFGLARIGDASTPEIMLPRGLLEVRDEPSPEDAKTRIIEEDSNLYIVKAIMERSKRKWEFKWHGLTISAPIIDPNFYDDFAHHNFTIAPGDEFRARLAIHQRRDDVSGVYTNTRYEVVQVYQHISHPRATNLNLGSDYQEPRRRQ